MNWRDDGIILGLLKHGESAVVLEAFTHAHGRHKGYVHGGLSKAKRGVLQPGNLVALEWRGRLEGSLGNFSVEPQAAYAAGIMASPGPLAALRSLCAMLSRALPEHDPHPGLYEGFLNLVADLSSLADSDPAWGEAVVHFECHFLADIGYGLDLDSCAVTGATEGLAFVSPKTGRAVTQIGAGDYAPRMLRLPAFLTEGGAPDWADIGLGLRLTGHFLERFFAESDGRPLPEERQRLLALVDEKTARYGGAQSP